MCSSQRGELIIILGVKGLSDASRREACKGSSTDNKGQGRHSPTRLKSSRGRRNARAGSANNEVLLARFIILFDI